MKKTVLAMLLVCQIAFCMILKAQSPDYTIVYQTQRWANENGVETWKEDGGTLKWLVKGEKCRMETRMPHGGEVVSINEENAGITLIKDKDVKKYSLVSRSDTKPLDFEIHETGKTKEIVGYTCYQVIVKKANGQESEVWYTRDIKVKSRALNNSFGKGLDGFVLEELGPNKKAGIRLVAVEVSTEELEEGFFDLTPPAGYEEFGQPLKPSK